MSHAKFPARFCSALAGLAVRAPKFVLLLGLFSVLASLAFAAGQLQYRTQRNDLLAADAPCQQRWQKYLDTFGDDDDAVLVIRGDSSRAKLAADRVAGELSKQPDQFDRVFHRVDLRALHSRSLYHLSAADLRSLDRKLDGMQPLLGPLAPLGWRALGIQALLARSAAAAELQAAGKSLTDEERELLQQMPALLAAAEAYLKEPSKDVNPWRVRSLPEDDRQLLEPQYLTTPDRALTIVLARPKKADTFTPARDAAECAREILRETQREFPELELGLTGLPILETDEMLVGDRDSMRASALALLGVAVLYLVVYRGMRYPLLTIGTLLVGTAWALGWATLTVGHLNILTSAFAVMLIGLGDYGVLFVARYDDERRRGLEKTAAILATATTAGPGILTAALTTSCAFFATMLADFAAVVELGWIAGSGVLFCALATLLLLPAALQLSGTAIAIKTETRAGQPNDRPRRLLPWLLVGIATLGAFRLHYDANLLHLQADGLESVKWERELLEHSAGATWDVIGIARDREEAIRLRELYATIPGVGRVVDAAAIVPPADTEKQKLIAGIRAKLAGLPAQPAKPIPPGDVVVPSQKLAAAKPELHSQLQRFDQLARQHPERLHGFDCALATALHGELQRLQAISDPTPPRLDELPAAFRERYLGSNGEYLVRGLCNRDLWQFDELAAFTTAAERADPKATGKAFRTVEGLRTMKAGFLKAGLFALVVIVIVLTLDLRSLRGVLLGLFPLVVGAGTTAGLMGWLGIPLNPANLIALPLIVGVGVDNGIHVLHDFAERDRRRVYTLSRSTARGIAVAALTTVLGFGALAISQHRGMASLGIILAIGVSACLFAALGLLPSVLRRLNEPDMETPILKFPMRESSRRAA
jgi:uncharacterized protein